MFDVLSRRAGLDQKGNWQYNSEYLLLNTSENLKMSYLHAANMFLKLIVMCTKVKLTEKLLYILSLFPVFSLFTVTISTS